MSNNKIRGKDLKKINFDTDISRSIAVMVASKYFKHESRDEILRIFSEVSRSPGNFLDDSVLSVLANTFIQKNMDMDFTAHDLLESAAPLRVFGKQFIEEAAIKQMELAMSLPVSLQGALMPDAHSGYGLPIGAVLATRREVIPFGVGVDIGCRMALSVFDLPEKFIDHKEYELKKALKEFTHFGMDGSLEFKQDHEVLEREEFKQTPLLKKLHGKAIRQLGSSGSGNHFVEFGIMHLDENNSLAMPGGKYLALLSHSGSRGLGANIADHYTRIALDTCKLPKHAQHFAWLDMDSSEGQEYWMSMNLAGDYAKACHDRIHINLGKALGITPVAKVENHHNFAWKEKDEKGQEIIVHRKGATPAHEGELGIIPGNMTDGGYLVRGLGVPASLNSASHGAGRVMSRNKAKNSITVSGFKKQVESAGVILIGGSPEESPMVYKNIDEVMSAQQKLVSVEGKFIPKIVRMHKE